MKQKKWEYPFPVERVFNNQKIADLTKKLQRILEFLPSRYMKKTSVIKFREIIEDIYALQRHAEDHEALKSHPGNLVVLEIDTTVCGHETVWILGETKQKIHLIYKERHMLKHFNRCLCVANGYTYNLDNYPVCAYCRLKTFRPITTDDGLIYCSEYDKWMYKQLSA